MLFQTISVTRRDKSTVVVTHLKYALLISIPYTLGLRLENNIKINLE